jgi:hypothetical protein
MRAIAIAAVALVALAGCNKLGIGGSAATNSTNATTTANAAAAGNAAGTQTADAAKPAGTAGATPASAPGPGGTMLDRAYLLGHWTDNGDCGKAISFNQDGSFTNADGGSGLWNLDGDRLTMTGQASTVRVRVTPIDQNTITVINADGSLGRSTRC